MKDVFFGAPWNFLDSENLAKMRDELTTLLGMYHQVEKAGGIATLTISTRGGKCNIKFAIELDAAASESTSVSTLTSSAGPRSTR